jgi:hypothetical protein
MHLPMNNDTLIAGAIVLLVIALVLWLTITLL